MALAMEMGIMCDDDSVRSIGALGADVPRVLWCLLTKVHWHSDQWDQIGA